MLTAADPWDDAALLTAVNAMQNAVKAAQTDELLAPTPPPQQLPQGLSAADTSEWTFDIFSVNYDQLPQVAYLALTSYPELSAPISQIDHEKLWRYVTEVAARYHKRPFHSFRHGVDVLLAISSLLRTLRRDHAESLTDPIEVGSLLVAALVHDTNHPGCMNGFLVATEHPLAAASAQSVLERHHAEMALALLERPELDFLDALSAEDRTRFVGLIEQVVLETDVTTTVPTMKAFAQTVADGVTPDAKSLMSMLVKAADISNPARPLATYERWIDGVMVEFFAQGDAEKAKGLPISMNCDRETVVMPKAQVGFITFLVAPLYQALLSYAPSLQPIVKQLEANRAHFASVSDPKVNETPSTDALKAK